MDEIQKLIEISDRQSAIEYLKNVNKRAMRKIVCRLIFENVEDNSFIARITSGSVAEVEGLRDYLTFEEAMNELGLSEKSLKAYIRQGLTANDQGIPRFAIEFMKKDFVYSVLMQKEFQDQKLKTQTKEERIEEIKEEIMEFEKEYGGKFEKMFGDLTDGEILYREDGNEVILWKDLIEELWEIRRKMGE